MNVSAKYKEVLETLRGEIRGGKYAAERIFPSSTALARRFGTTRFTIRQALDCLEHEGYIRSRQGKGTFVRTLGPRHLSRIGLIVHGNNYCEVFPPLCKELSRLVQQRCNGALLLGDISSANPNERAAQAVTLAQNFVGQKVDGVVFQPIEFVADAEQENRRILSIFADAGIPVVLLDYDCLPPPDRSFHDVVGINDFSAGRTLGAHLIAQGARRIGFLTQPNRAACIQNRGAGVELACAERKIPFRRFYAQPDDVRAVKRFVTAFKPQAVVCYNDAEAVILLRTLEKLGVRVPADVMLAGCDDVFNAAYASVPLTTIHKPVTAIAEGLLQCLRARLDNPALPPVELCFSASLVVRASTKGLRRK